MQCSAIRKRENYMTSSVMRPLTVLLRQETQEEQIPAAGIRAGILRVIRRIWMIFSEIYSGNPSAADQREAESISTGATAATEAEISMKISETEAAAGSAALEQMILAKPGRAGI